MNCNICVKKTENDKKGIQSNHQAFFTEDLWFLSGISTVLLQDLTGMNHHRMAAK